MVNCIPCPKQCLLPVDGVVVLPCMLCQRNYWRTSCTSRIYLQRALQPRHKTGPPGFLGRGSKEGQSSPTFDLWWHVSLAVHCHKSRYFLHFLQICPDGDWCIQLKCQEKVFLILSWYQRINSLFCLSKDQPRIAMFVIIYCIMTFIVIKYHVRM